MWIFHPLPYKMEHCHLLSTHTRMPDNMACQTLWRRGKDRWQVEVPVEQEAVVPIRIIGNEDCVGGRLQRGLLSSSSSAFPFALLPRLLRGFLCCPTHQFFILFIHHSNRKIANFPKLSLMSAMVFSWLQAVGFLASENQKRHLREAQCHCPRQARHTADGRAIFWGSTPRPAAKPFQLTQPLLFWWSLARCHAISVHSFSRLNTEASTSCHGDALTETTNTNQNMAIKSTSSTTMPVSALARSWSNLLGTNHWFTSRHVTAPGVPYFQYYDQNCGHTGRFIVGEPHILRPQVVAMSDPCAMNAG